MSEIPTCIEDLSKEWLHKTLSEALKVKNIEILELKPISSIGYLSQALKATFKTGWTEANFLWGGTTK